MYDFISPQQQLEEFYLMELVRLAVCLKSTDVSEKHFGFIISVTIEVITVVARRVVSWGQ
jgi:hypothetical protein